MVKRKGYLMGQICRIENLYESFLRASKGKSNRKQVVHFRENLDEELARILHELQDGTYQFLPYDEFVVYEPKERKICAASFRDRVTFHAMMRCCHNIFDNYQIYDSYASRIGKGVYAALERAMKYARRNTWFAKLDVVKYFDSIDQNILMSQLSRLFKDPQLLMIFHRLLGTYETKKDKGLPIGNLTSQYFANHYLSVADHYLKEKLGVGDMVRYMDDVVLFSDDKDKLLMWCRQYRSFLKDELNLVIHPVTLNRTCFGLPFLGYVIYPYSMRLNQNSRSRFRRKMWRMKKAVQSELMGCSDYVQRATAMYAFIEKADVEGFKKNVKKDGLFP